MHFIYDRRVDLRFPKGNRYPMSWLEKMSLVSVYRISERLLDGNGQYDINKVQEIKKAVE